MAQLQRIMGSGYGAQTSRLLNGTLADGLVATGSSQTDALQLIEDTNIVTQVSPGTGVKLPTVPQPGDELAVFALGGNALNVYPGVGGAIHAQAGNQPWVIPDGMAACFTARTGSKNWIVLATGTASQIAASLNFSLPANSQYVPLISF